jgi:hypothetical protein
VRRGAVRCCPRCPGVWIGCGPRARGHRRCSRRRQRGRREASPATARAGVLSAPHGTGRAAAGRLLGCTRDLRSCRCRGGRDCRGIRCSGNGEWREDHARRACRRRLCILRCATLPARAGGFPAAFVPAPGASSVPSGAPLVRFSALLLSGVLLMLSDAFSRSARERTRATGPARTAWATIRGRLRPVPSRMLARRHGALRRRLDRTAPSSLGASLRMPGADWFGSGDGLGRGDCLG